MSAPLKASELHTAKGLPAKTPVQIEVAVEGEDLDVQALIETLLSQDQISGADLLAFARSVNGGAEKNMQLSAGDDRRNGGLQNQ
jgi:hypothetical protein